jgi:hypothetical protein
VRQRRQSRAKNSDRARGGPSPRWVFGSSSSRRSGGAERRPPLVGVLLLRARAQLGATPRRFGMAPARAAL